MRDFISSKMSTIGLSAEWKELPDGNLRAARKSRRRDLKIYNDSLRPDIPAEWRNAACAILSAAK